MILTVLALGGTLLGATTIAGLLLTYQIRQTSDFGSSARAIFAADAGVEYGMYQFFKGGSGSPVFSNGAGVEVRCFDSGSTQIACTDENVASIWSRGTSGKSFRAFELAL